MHSPEVVAFSIRSPFPHIMKPMTKNPPRWQSIWHRRVDGSHFISPFAYVAGKELYFPELITIWHMEPGGHDSLTICKDRVRDKNGKFVRWSNTWRWHIHHWKIQWCFLQAWRRSLLTRCNVCGGRSTRKHPVNVSDSWSRDKTPFWQGEKGLHHMDCSATPPNGNGVEL